MKLFKIIAAKPLYFLAGFIIASVFVVTSNILLYEDYPGLWIGLQAGLQGAIYLITYQKAERAFQQNGY